MSEMSEKYLFYDLSDNSVVFDVGAFEGKWSEWVVETYGCNVFAYEPFLNNFVVAQKRLKKLKSVVLSQSAIGRTDGTCNLYITENRDGCSIYNRANAPVKKKIIETVKIKINTLRTEMVNNGIDKIDLVKINAEGAEVDILLSLDSKLYETVRQISFSGHAGKIVTKEQLQQSIDYAVGLGYKLKTHQTKRFNNRFLLYRDGEQK